MNLIALVCIIMLNAPASPLGGDDMAEPSEVFLTKGISVINDAYSDNAFFGFFVNKCKPIISGSLSIHFYGKATYILLGAEYEASRAGTKYPRRNLATSIRHGRRLIFKRIIKGLNSSIYRDVINRCLTTIFYRYEFGDAWNHRQMHWINGQISTQLGFFGMSGNPRQISSETSSGYCGQECEKQNRDIEVINNVSFLLIGVAVAFFGFWQMIFGAAAKGLPTWFFGAICAVIGGILIYEATLSLIKFLLI